MGLLFSFLPFGTYLNLWLYLSLLLWEVICERVYLVSFQIASYFSPHLTVCNDKLACTEKTSLFLLLEIENNLASIFVGIAWLLTHPFQLHFVPFTFTFLPHLYCQEASINTVMMCKITASVATQFHLEGIWRFPLGQKKSRDVWEDLDPFPGDPGYLIVYVLAHAYRDTIFHLKRNVCTKVADLRKGSIWGFWGESKQLHPPSKKILGRKVLAGVLTWCLWLRGPQCGTHGNHGAW